MQEALKAEEPRKEAPQDQNTTEHAVVLDSVVDALDISIGETLGQAIVVSLDEHLQRNNKQWRVKSNRASMIGHPCLRFHALNRTRWKEKTLFGIDTLRRFKEGNLHEGAVLGALRDAGITIIEQQRPFEWPEYDISGMIDGKVLIDDRLAEKMGRPDLVKRVVPVEIKSASPYSFAKINSVADMMASKYVYMRGYPAQMNIYLMMANEELGLFLFKDKNSGAIKPVPVDLDLELAEQLVQRAERVNSFLRDEITIEDMPRIPYEEITCGDCGFNHICIPDVKRDALSFESDPELEEQLARRAELAAAYREYNALDKTVKAKLKDVEKAVIGDFYITGKTVTRQMAAKEAYETSFWQTKIEQLGGGA